MIMQAIQQWQKYSWLSYIDGAFVNFIAEQEPNATDSLLWASALVSQQLSLGEVYVDLAKLSQNVEAVLGITCADEAQSADSSLAKIKSYTLTDWQTGLANTLVVGTGEGNSPLVLTGSRLYLRRYWQCQQTVDQGIQQRLLPCRDSLPAPLKAQITQLFSAQLQQPDWQKIACVLALRARFSIITGGPGTGKTTTLTKLLAILVQLLQGEAKEQHRLNILLAAPTGKAAARVSESINKAISALVVADAIKALMPTKAMTLHRLLGTQAMTRQFKHHRNNPFVADIVIVDEASMIDLEMMAALLDALPETATLILLGDKDQLASVEAGAVLGDLCQGAVEVAYDANTQAWLKTYAKEDVAVGKVLTANQALNQQTVILKHSYRFGEHSGIGQLATVVNAGDFEKAQAILESPHFADLHPKLASTKQTAKNTSSAASADGLLKALVCANWGETNAGIPEACQGYGYYRALIKKRPKDNTPTAINTWAKQVLKAFDTFQVLCALRKGQWGVEGLNERIEHWLVTDKKAQMWYEGRPIMITSNDYSLDLMNGDIGLALIDHTEQLRVVFIANEKDHADGLHWVSPLRLPHVETAYAMTVHKSQGSEFNHVAMVLPDVASRVLTRELIYTGITRAKENFSLIEPSAGVFSLAIKASCVG